ncbi:hypothetical protein [Legionella sp. km772]|uniref:hypothetical protein n=1 Tax=Legionella sp. km772 TaxID=2498111 RepID=UPI0013158537|nr:hypothetical protein [Legionella sp. km772]
MNKEKLKDNESYRHQNEQDIKRPIEHETDKRGQRQGGIDKKGQKEKDIKRNG